MKQYNMEKQHLIVGIITFPCSPNVTSCVVYIYIWNQAWDDEIIYIFLISLQLLETGILTVEFPCPCGICSTQCTCLPHRMCQEHHLSFFQSSNRVILPANFEITKKCIHTTLHEIWLIFSFCCYKVCLWLILLIQSVVEL